MDKERTLETQLNELYGQEFEDDVLLEEEEEEELYPDYCSARDVDNSEGINDGFYQLAKYSDSLVPFGVEDALTYFKKRRSFNSEEPEENARFLSESEMEKFKEECKRRNIKLEAIRITPLISVPSGEKLYELCFKKFYKKYPTEYAPVKKYDGYQYLMVQ